MDGTIVSLVVGGVIKLIKWKGGISSGWLLTSLLDSLINLLYLEITS